MADAGTIVINLDAKSAKLLAGLQRAQRGTRRSAAAMRRDMSKAMAAMGKSTALFVAALGVAVKRSVSMADQIAKTADKLGVSTTKLQQWRFAAQRSGMTVQQFDKGMERFTRTVGEYTQGLSTTIRAYDQLGVSVRNSNGDLKDAETLFLEVAEAISKLDNVNLRNTLLGNLFGGRNIGFGVLFKDGVKGITEFEQAANRLGIVLDEKLVRRAEEAQDAMGDLNQVFQVRLADAILQNTDAILQFTNGLISLVNTIGAATSGIDDLFAKFGKGLDTVEDIRIRGAQLLKERNAIQSQLDANQGFAVTAQGRVVDWLFGGTFEENRNDMRKRIAELDAEMQRLQDRAVQMQKDQTAAHDARAATAASRTGGDEGVNVEEQQRMDRIQKLLDGLRAKVQEFGLGEGDKAILELMNLDANEAALEQAHQAVLQLKELEATEERRKEAAELQIELQTEYAGLFQQTRTAAELHNEQIARLAELYMAGVIPSAEEYADVVARMGEKFIESQTQMSQLEEFGAEAARSMQRHFADFLFDPFDKGLKGMLEGFLQVLNRMIAEALAAELLKSLFGAMGGGAGGGFGEFLSGAIGGLAEGGPMRAGNPYLVGEKGPELIVPNMSGTVIPNHELSRLGSTFNTVVNLPPTVETKTAAQVAYQVAARQKTSEVRNR